MEVWGPQPLHEPARKLLARSKMKRRKPTNTLVHPTLEVLVVVEGRLVSKISFHRTRWRGGVTPLPPPN